MSKPQTDTVMEEALIPVFALVGRFIFQWNYIEFLIAKAVGDLLKLREPTASIVLANVTFRDKVHMLWTFCAITYGKSSQTEAKNARKLFTSILNFNTIYRNVLVHHPFLPRQSGIQILRTIAKGKLEHPKITWNKKFFEQRSKEIDQFEDRLQALVNDVKRRDGISRVAKALSEPTANIAQLGMLSHMYLAPQNNLDWAKSATNPEMTPLTAITPPGKGYR